MIFNFPLYKISREKQCQVGQPTYDSVFLTNKVKCDRDGCQTWLCSSNVKHRRIRGVKLTQSVWRFATMYIVQCKE